MGKGYLLHVGATVQCMHTGQAQATLSYPRVRVGGQAVTTQNAPYSIGGCTLPPPNAGNGPCVIAQWTTAATRVKAGGQCVLLSTSQASCTPPGTGVNVISTQQRVKGE